MFVYILLFFRYFDVIFNSMHRVTAGLQFFPHFSPPLDKLFRFGIILMYCEVSDLSLINSLFPWQVMVKGEGLRVIKHNRSGGSQTRIIRYNPEIKALVWDSKSYMKKGDDALLLMEQLS